MCKYGIALESHLQNCYIVFEDGLPLAVLVQDFGGIRVHQDRLADHELELDPYLQSDLSTDIEEELYRKLYYALFQNHLGELIATIAFEFDVDESTCWQRVRERCEQVFDSVRADQAVPAERVNRDENALFASPATHKALTAMRLQGKRHDYVTSHVTNPFSASL